MTPELKPKIYQVERFCAAFTYNQTSITPMDL